MPKYRVEVNFESEIFEFDTDDYKDSFAQTKDQLSDHPDPNDPDVIHDFIQEMEPADFDLYPSFHEILVTPKK